MSPEAVAAVERLDEIIERVTPIGSGPDRKNRLDIIAVHNYDTVIELAGRPTTVRVVVREMKDGRRYYDHFEVAERTPAPGERPAGWRTGPGGQRGSSAALGRDQSRSRRRGWQCRGEPLGSAARRDRPGRAARAMRRPRGFLR